MPTAREAAYLALIKQEKEDGYSNLILKETLRRYDLSPADRAFFKQLFYGVLEKRLILDYYIGKRSSIKLRKLSPQVLAILRMGVYQMLFLDRVPDSAACDESVKLAKRYAASAAGFINAVLRGISRGKKELSPPVGSSPEHSLSARRSISLSIAKLLIEQYGSDRADGMLFAMEAPQPHWLVRNPLRSGADEFIRLAENQGMNIYENKGLAARFSYSGDIEASGLYKKGFFHLQGKASMLCCEALSPQPGHTVIDLCAAPGGKSFTAAAMMENRGRIHALDVHSHRVALLRAGAARLGYSSVLPAPADSADTLFLPEKSADRILCDVPCSAIGLMGRRPELRYRDMENLDSLISLQYSILQNGARYLNPRGKLVYSTCTLNRAENENQTDRFILENPRFSYGKLPEHLLNRRGAATHGGHVTLFPDTDGTDGFFIAVLQHS